jgi:hypothetical protein
MWSHSSKENGRECSEFEQEAEQGPDIKVCEKQAADILDSFAF